MIGADIRFVKYKTLLCIVDYYSKFPIVNEANDLTADGLIMAAKIVFIRAHVYWYY